MDTWNRLTAVRGEGVRELGERRWRDEAKKPTTTYMYFYIHT